MYLIYGKNKVGQAVAQLCEQQKISYILADDSDNILDFSQFEAIIPSPGIPSFHRIYSTGKIISELDFAYQFLPQNFQILAITGTDGKSTTTWILYKALQQLEKNTRIYLSGNFEIPFSETVCQILQNHETDGIIVIEISSFMVYFIGKSILQAFSVDYSIFTNFKTDHLNWHSDLQEYLDSKMNLIKNTKKGAIINQQLLDFVKNYHLSIDFGGNKIFFGNDENFGNYTDGENIFVNHQNILRLSETNFSGRHNAMNLLSVAIILKKMGYEDEKIGESLRQIFGLPHRLEDLGMYGKVRVIEDSKSTSAQSLEAALGAFGTSKNLLLIVGGSDKGDTFEHLSALFARRVKKLACIGATKKLFSDIARKCEIPFLETDSLVEATNWLYEDAKKDDVLMLSPGCASFGLFVDYLDRANQFRESIKNLL